MPSVHKKYVYTRSCRFCSIVFIIHLLNVTSSISIWVCKCVSVFEYIKILHICARLKYTVVITIFDICIHVLLLHCIESKSSIYLQVNYRWFFSFKIYNIIKVLQLKFVMWDLRKRCMAEDLTITNVLPLHYHCPRKAFYSDERLAYFWVRYFMYMYILQYVRSLPVAVGCFTKWCSHCIFISTFKERPCFITKCLYTRACACTECKCI